MIDGLDMTDLASMVRSREVSARELAEDAFARIDRVNPKINAVIRLMRAEADETMSQPLTGPFAGVPFLVKDLGLGYKGVPTSAGSPMLAEIPEAEDSELMARYRRAGLVTLGKTNTPEFGTLGTCEPKLFGPCRNPWDLSVSSGGSSGGAAAAVAARVVPCAHANDGAGSIRIPASCCGLFGVKPSKGRISAGPKIGEASVASIGVEHCVSISVRDSAALLDATEGPLPGDPYMAPRPTQTFLSQMEQAPGRLRIALTDRSLTGTQLDPACVAAVRDTAKLCERLGHIVELAAPCFDYETYAIAYRRLWPLTITRSLFILSRVLDISLDAAAARCEAFNRHMFEIGRQIPAGQYLADIVIFNRFARVTATFLNDYDVWLTPTLGTTPPPLGHFDADLCGGETALDRFMEFLCFTPFANMTGEPAMTVPLYWDEKGLPIGTHFTAGYAKEGLLFSLAHQLEQARPWACIKPPITA